MVDLQVQGSLKETDYPNPFQSGFRPSFGTKMVWVAFDDTTSGERLAVEMYTKITQWFLTPSVVVSSSDSPVCGIECKESFRIFHLVLWGI